MVGAGRVGRLLIRSLPEGWRCTVVDNDPAKLDLLPDEHRGQPLHKFEGDASSRLVLEQVGIGPRTVVVVVTGDDAVNREVARVAREEFGVEEMVCLVDHTEGVEEAGLAQREVVQRFKATAMIVLNRLTGVESRGIAVGLGEGEIREVTVHEGSAAIGRQLQDLKPSHWLVGAIYRDGKLIVPTGESSLEAADRVLLIGEPDVIDKVGRFVRGGEPVFPTQYGPRVGLLEGNDQEARWLIGHTQAEGLVNVPRERLRREAAEQEADAAHHEGLSEDGVGCLVVAPERVGLWARIGFARSSFNNMLGAARVPFIVARGSFPYRRILLALGSRTRAESIASVAIDVVRQVEGELTMLTVVPPTLSERDGDQASLRHLPREIAALARVHGVEVDRRLDEGNPIKVIRRHAEEFDLLVVGHSPHHRNTLITPDVSLFLLHDAPCSVLFVPDNAVRR